MEDMTYPTKSAHVSHVPQPKIPTDITLAHFILDGYHPFKPRNPNLSIHSGLIEEKSGRMIGLQELRSRTIALACGLRAKYGIVEDDVVLISSPNHIDYPVLVWAVHYLGATVTLSNPNFTADELSYHIKLTQPTLIIAHPASYSIARICAQTPTSRGVIRVLPLENTFDITASVNDLILSQNPTSVSKFRRTIRPREGLSEKIAALCLSSGTTGLPKVVRITHRSFMANLIQMIGHTWLEGRPLPGLRPGDVALGLLPFYHAAGLVINLHFFLLSEVSIVAVEKYDFLQMLDMIERFRITTLILVPPQAVSLCKHPATRTRDLHSIKRVTVGAAPVPKEVHCLLEEVFPRAHIGQAYGTTEATCTVSMHSSPGGPPGNAGKIVPWVEARVIKEDGTIARPGELGELYVKGDSVALGYLNNDAANRETFGIPGWVRTGDQVYITEEGYIFIQDRIKDFIKVKGFQVAPAELEGCILDHPDVADVCVIGIPDPFCGEVPRAFVVLTPSKTHRSSDQSAIRHSIMEHVESRKASYKHLRGGLEFVSSIPKTGSGKVLRRKIRAECLERLAKL